MGGFYSNVSVKTTDTNSLLEMLREIGAPFSAAADGEYIVVADERLDNQDEEWLEQLTVLLSQKLKTAALGVLVHDDSVLLMVLADANPSPLRYNSCPDYFDGVGGSAPSGADASRFVTAFDRISGLEGLQGILSAELPVDPEADYKYAFESDRHADICRVLGFPAWAVFFTHAGLAEHPPESFDSKFVISNNSD